MDEFFYGTLPQDTQDFTQVLRGVGRSIGDVARGVSYYPYDLLGSGVDIANMALTPLGLGSERPVLGSDYLRNIAQSLGLAQPSTGSGAETAARFGAAFINPAAGARVVGQIPQAITRGANVSADKLVQMITQNPRATAMGVIDETSMPFMQAVAPRNEVTKITREGSPIQSAVVLIGDKIFTGQTHGQALNRAIYEGVVKKEGNKYIYPKDAEVNMDLFLTKDGRIVDRLDAYKEFDIGASETAIEKGLMQVKPASSMTVDQYIAEAEKIKSLLEPQAGATKIPPEVPQSLLDNPNLRNWVKGSEAVKESGEPITLYHATTHDFDTFSLDRANPENHYGKGFYLTDSVDDANLNYAGIGPDLEIRIERRTEQLADELMDMDAEEIADMAKSLKVDDSLIDVAKIEESGASPELIREIATKELTTHGGAVMPVFARLRNPVKVGTKDETTFRIDTEFDDAGDVVSESGNGIDLYNSLNDVGRQYDIPRDQIEDVWAKISDEMAGDEITAGRVDKIIRDNIYDVYTPDGEIAGPGQFIADVFRDMGFDGIKMDAGKYFGPRQVGTGINVKGMEGVKDATHYIVFEPTQIKSATGNIGTYSLTDPSIIRGAGIGAAGLLGAGMYQDEQMY